MKNLNLILPVLILILILVVTQCYRLQRIKIFRSIKWRLQLWYGLLLAITIIGGIGTDYQLEQERENEESLRELNGRIQAIMDVVRRPPRRGDENDMQPGMGPPGGKWPGNPGAGRPADNPDIDNFFNETAGGVFYYVMWSPEGDELKHSTDAPSELTMPLHPGVQRRGIYYELAIDHLPPSPDLPPGSMLLVGRSVAGQLTELHRRLEQRIFIGAWILFGTLFVGWVITTRMIKPIKSISATAVKIAAGDLSQRINAAETESELGQLAAVLNSTFTRLESAFAQQKQFASDAAHELRTPVSVILTQTQAALNREREAKDYKLTIEACQRAAQRMRKLISALLELARLDAGQEQMKRLRFDFSKTVADCVELIRPLTEERGIKLVTELLPMEIPGDSERLGQVITNLLTNAIEYNHDSGEVKVGLKPENGMAVLTVSDTGQGIAAEDLPRVFERFYRADKSRSSGNAGLGLAIGKAIVGAHGGNIEVQSKENAGTTFTVRLPA